MRNCRNCWSLKETFERINFAWEKLRDRGDWDTKAHVKGGNSDPAKRMAQVEGNVNFSILARRGFIAGDNRFLGLNLASRFSGAYALLDSARVLVKLNKTAIERPFTARENLRYHHRASHLGPYFENPRKILNRPYGEKTVEDIVLIELAQEFDVHLERNILLYRYTWGESLLHYPE